jgi:Transposase DDE domain
VWCQAAAADDPAVEPDPPGGKSTGRAGRPSREAIGRSRGGLTSKIHLAADRRCRPISRVTSAGQRHDSLGLRPVMAGIRIRRRGPGRPRTRPGRVLGDKAYSSRAIRSYLRDAGSRPRSPNRPTRRRTGCGGAVRAGGHPGSTPRPTNSATSSNAPSTSSRPTGRWPPATTNATTRSAEPSTSPRSESGSATPSHDPRDRL